MIPHNKPTLGKEEEIAALRILRSGQLSYGDEARKFENEFCGFLGLPEGHAVAVSSGSSALFLAMKILFKEKETIKSQFRLLKLTELVLEDYGQLLMLLLAFQVLGMVVHLLGI